MTSFRRTVFVERVRRELVVFYIAIDARGAMPEGGVRTIRTQSVPASDGLAAEPILVLVAATRGGMAPESGARGLE